MKNKVFNTLLATATLTGAFSAIVPIFFAQPASADDSNDVTVTIEAPAVQTTQLPNSNYYVVDFNDRSGTSSFSKTNDGKTYSYSNDLDVKNANQWGGAGGSKFITQASGKRSYKVTINEDQKYFGFWWSAGDSANKITFKNNNQEVAVFYTSDLVRFINSSGVSNPRTYYGNPNCVSTNTICGSNTGHLNEPYAFVNVFFKNSKVYDEIVVETTTTSGAAFESDNHTFSTAEQQIRGSIVQPVTVSITSPNSTIDTTPEIFGRTEANNIVNMSLDLDRNGTFDVTYRTTANGNGNWSINTETATPVSGSRPNLKGGDIIDVKAIATNNENRNSEPATQTLTIINND